MDGWRLVQAFFLPTETTNHCGPLRFSQGRLPIRVSLKGLTAEDFYRILTEPEHNMIKQQQVRGPASRMPGRGWRRVSKTLHG